MKEYTVEDFKRDFPNNAAVLRYIHRRQDYGDVKLYVPTKGGNHLVDAQGRAYNPLKGTIFYDRKLPLRLWFYGIFALHFSPFWTVRSFAKTMGISHVSSFKMLRVLKPIVNTKVGFKKDLNRILDHIDPNQKVKSRKIIK